ncbi:MAG: BMC domain-containing protein, partial [Anaerolineae bacterium]
VLDHVYLPGVHPDVPASIAAARRPDPIEALGIVETGSVAAAIQAADAGLKGAQVTLLELRLADGLGGKGLAFFTGSVTNVETAVSIACDAIDAIDDSGRLLNAVIIPQLHGEMAENLLDGSRFRQRARSL